MASIYRRKGTRYWWGRFTYKGRPFRRSLETTSRTVAEERLEAWRNQVKAVPWDGPVRLFDDMMLSFVEHHMPTLKPNSRQRYMVSIRKLIPEFTGQNILEIKSKQLAAYEMERRRQGAASPTIRRDLQCLSSAYTHAIVDLEWCEDNPVPVFLARQKRRGRLQESPPKRRWLTHAEERKLLEEAHPELADEIRVAIDTGLRDTELRTLTWAQVDFAKGEITVESGTAKNNRERQIPMLERTVQLLQSKPRHLHSPYVFYTPEGKAYTTRAKGLAAAIRRSGIKRLTWHDLRRTCGCRLLQDHGMSMEQVRDWLGHTTIQQTERAYAFLTVENLKEAISK